MWRFFIHPLVLGLVLLLGTVALMPGASRARQATPPAQGQDPSAWTMSWASGINDRGQVVGWAGPGDLRGRHAVLWEDGAIAALGELPGGGWSEANAINDAGQVVGQSGTAAGGNHAVLWDDGNVVDLGALPGLESDANDINDRGQIVGLSYMGWAKYRAVIWEDGQIAELGTHSAAD